MESATCIEAEIPRNVPAFLAKLYSMINDPDTDAHIHWGDKPTHFIIVSPKHFSEKLLPLNFKHSNFASFVRQLNMYGFRKVADMSQLTDGATSTNRHNANAEDSSLRAWEFEHPYLVRDQPHLLLNIQRKSKHGAQTNTVVASPGTATRSTRAPVIKEETPTPFQQSSIMRTVQVMNEQLAQELRRSKEENIALTKRQRIIEEENRTLWREYTQCQKKLKDQQEATSRIIAFLNTIYSPPNKVGDKRKVSTELPMDFPMMEAKRAPSADSTAPIFETDFVFQPVLSDKDYANLNNQSALISPAIKLEPCEFVFEEQVAQPLNAQNNMLDFLGDELDVSTLASFEDDGEEDQDQDEFNNEASAPGAYVLDQIKLQHELLQRNMNHERSAAVPLTNSPVMSPNAWLLL